MFQFLILALLAWGALAFGAEYSWAYAPLVVLALTVGFLGLLTSRGVRLSSRSVVVALGVILVAATVTTIPLPPRVTAAVSHASGLANYDQLYATATMQPDARAAAQAVTTPRTLSIAPRRTLLGLVFVTAFAFLFAGCLRGISAVGPRWIARGILALGVIAALLELIQNTLGTPVVYGFWYPPQLKYHAAPFINRNHTAGWLAMALSLSIGHFAGLITSALRRVKPDWRHRLLWLSSSDASETLVTGFAIAVMAIAIIATASRSGAASLAMAVIVLGWWTARTLRSGGSKAVVFALLVAAVLAAVSLGGVEVLAGRLRGTPSSMLDGRLGIWQDTLRIARDFPIAGTGLNTYGIAMLHYQTVNDGSQYIESHNDYLQIISEGGLLLGVPILIALGFFIREIRRRFREAADDTRTYWLRAGAVTGLCAIAVQEVSDFTLQMPGAAVLFVVLAAIAIHRPDHVRRAPASVVEQT